MKALYSFLFFFSSSYSLYSKTPQGSVSQTEVFIWGSIFFSISLGSLLLVVHLFPKRNSYRSNVETEFSYEESLPPEINSTSEEIKIESSKNIDSNTTTFSSVTSIDTIPQTPDINNQQSQTNNSSSSTITSNTSYNDSSSKDNKVCTTVNFDIVYKMKLLDVENICREFIEKLNETTKVRSISLYFLKNDTFVRYIEKRLNNIYDYDKNNEKSDLSEDIIKYLIKKLGAFSSTQSDAVLPLIYGNQIFGAIKFNFFNPIQNNDINLIWKEIKLFSSFFHETYFSNQNLEEEESEEIQPESFQENLIKDFNNNSSNTLFLIKVFNIKNISNFSNLLSLKLQKLIKKKIEIFRINDDTYSFIIDSNSIELLENNIGMFLGELINEDTSLEICIGSSKRLDTIKSHDEWFKTALSSLKIAVSKGNNKFHFIK